MAKRRDLFSCLEQKDLEGVRAALLHDPKAARRPNWAGDHPLYCAVPQPEMVRILLEGGAAVDDRSHDGLTPLHAAVEYEVESARMLLAAGADPNVRDDKGATPLFRAMGRGGEAAVLLLLDAGADPRIPTHDGVTPLALAARRGLADRMRLLLARGADARSMDKSGRTPMHEVACAVGDKCAIMAELLIEAGADPDARDEEGNTPLALAAIRSYHDVLEVFLGPRVRASPMVRDAKGRTPLHRAPPSAPSTELLLAAGAEVDARDDEGSTPLMESCLAWTEDASEVLLAHGADKEARNAAGQTPLHIAARKGSEENVALLLRAGASPETRDAEGLRPLDLAYASDKVQEMLALAMGLEKIERLRLGFVVDRGRTLEGRVTEVLPRIPVIHLRSRLDLSVYSILTCEQEKRGWAFREHHRFGDEDTAESMVRRVNPFHGRVNPRDYDDLIVIGRYFAFCRAGANRDPAFLSWLGVDRVPAVLPRFGVEEEGHSGLDLRLDPFSRLAPSWPSLAIVSPARPLFSPGADVPILALCLHADGRRGGRAEVHLRTGGVEVPQSRRLVDVKGGLGLSTWASLPQGQYTAILEWEGNEARCAFTVGSHSLSLAHAEWVDGPRRQDGRWQGRARLFVRGTPLAPGVAVDIGGSDADGSAFTQDDGLLDIDLACGDEREMRSLRLGWRDERDDVAHLPLPVADVVESGGVRVAAAHTAGSEEAFGLHFSVTGSGDQPLRLLRPCGEVATWEAVRDVEGVAVTVLFAGRDPQTRTFGPLRAGQSLQVDLAGFAGAYAFLCVGALAGNEVFEAAVPFARPGALALACEAPREAVAGQDVRVTVRVDGKPAAVAVLVQDVRLHGGFERDAAAARLDEVRGALHAVEGPVPPLFSAAWLDGTFLARATGGEAPRGGSPRGTIQVDLLPDRPRTPSLLEAMGFLGGGRTGEAQPAAEGVKRVAADAPGEDPLVGETVFAAMVKVKRGRVEVSFPAPTSPCTLSVQVIAVDAVRASWASSQATVRVRAPLELYTDAMPPAVLPEDAGLVTGRLSVGSAVGPVVLSATVDGEPVPLDLPAGPLVADPPRDVCLALRPGLFTVCGTAGDHEVARTFRVRRADVVTERVRRMVVLAPGQAFRVGPHDVVHEMHVAPLDEIARGSGSALADYGYRCCEQTAAAMFGAWGTMFGLGGEGRLEAWSSISAGLRRLETMWRGDGFALYPQERHASQVYGRQAYLHLLAMQVFRRILGDRAVSGAVLDRLDDLVARCRRTYGAVPNGRVRSCREAWLASDGRRREAVAYVGEHWRVEHRDPVGLMGWAGGADGVATRAETCYAAAVLLADEGTGARRRSEIQGTMAWLGGQMREGGRLYSSIDSAALVALLAEASRHFPTGATLSIDGGPPLGTGEARLALAKAVPREVMCFEGQVNLLVDATSETAVHVGDTDVFALHFEVGGARVEEAPLGAEVEMVLDAGTYRDGLFAHFVLPPCLALEEGGGRLQAFQRDFEGASLLRLKVRATERSGGVPWHGVVVLQNLFVEEEHVGQRVAFKVV